MIGVVPPPGMKPGGGGGANSAEKLSIDSVLVEYVTFPLASIQATLFLLGSVSRATFPVLATLYSASPSTNLNFCHAIFPRFVNQEFHGRAAYAKRPMRSADLVDLVRL